MNLSLMMGCWWFRVVRRFRNLKMKRKSQVILMLQLQLPLLMLILSLIMFLTLQIPLQSLMQILSMLLYLAILLLIMKLILRAANWTVPQATLSHDEVLGTMYPEVSSPTMSLGIPRCSAGSY